MLCFASQGFDSIPKVKVLQEDNCFSEAEKEIIDFVHQVENIYSGFFQKNKQIVVQSR